MTGGRKQLYYITFSQQEEERGRKEDSERFYGLSGRQCPGVLPLAGYWDPPK
jgi:hypothetical protein